MKHLLAFFLILLHVSCKKELPANIRDSLARYNGYATSLNEVDSAIWVMTPEDIKRTNNLSVKTLVDRSDKLTQSVSTEENKLNELLKQHPEYSDELDSKVYPFYKNMKWEEGGGKILSNKNLMRKRVPHHLN